MSKRIVSVVVFAALCFSSGESALRKSWKSPANFEADIPKFTPFESEEVASGGGSDSDSIKTTEVVTEPTPSAETLTNNKISSRIKMPEKYVADIYSTLTKEALKKSQDFGRFAYQVPETESSEESDENEIPSSKFLGNPHSGEEEIDDASEDDQDEDDDGVELFSTNDSIHYNVEKLLNVTVDGDDNTVNVNLDQYALKGMFSGRAGNKKNGMLERVVPLFIIPFLIQSAIVPFMITSIKLFLMKSLFAGKIAILFFLLGALKNHQNSIYMKSFAAQNQPFLSKDYSGAFIPERRIETGFDGYKVDGKPESFIN